MGFRLAYDLVPEVGRELVLVREDNSHHKVRVLVTGLEQSGETVTLTGNSLGSSYRPIKAAKKEEPPVPVRGEFTSRDGRWQGELEQVR